MQRYDLNVCQGETFRQVLRFENPDGSPLSLSGKTGASQVRETPDHGTLICQMGVLIEPEEGRVTLSIPAETTAGITPGIYFWDFCLTDETSTRFYLGGKFIVLPAVTEVNHE